MLDEPSFTLSQVADACEVPVNTIRTWFKRGHLTLGLKDKAGAKGIASLVSGRTALVIGIAGTLVQMGVHPARAAMTGIAFAHVDSWDPQTDERRDPGELWPGQGLTLLVLPADASVGPGGGAFQRVTADTKFIEIFNSWNTGRRIRGAILLEMDELVMTIRARLGLPREGGE